MNDYYDIIQSELDEIQAENLEWANEGFDQELKFARDLQYEKACMGKNPDIVKFLKGLSDTIKSVDTVTIRIEDLIKPIDPGYVQTRRVYRNIPTPLPNDIEG